MYTKLQLGQALYFQQRNKKPLHLIKVAMENK